jgi:hypothetical protein
LGDTAKNPEEREDIMHQALMSDFFLMSSNAITEDGELFNIDGKGKEDQIYTIVSQSENYTLSLLITKDSAIIYSLPTKTLSNSETHIEDILVMDHLRDNLGYKVNDDQYDGSVMQSE